MTTEQIGLIDFLMNTFFPNYIEKKFQKKNILNIEKKEIENYNFKYYIIDCDFFETKKNNSSDVLILLQDLYLKKFSFETLIQDICSKQNKYKFLYSFVKRISYTIRYSKKYKTITCTEIIDLIDFIEKSNNGKKTIHERAFKEWKVNKFILRKVNNKLFNINKNNKVLMYFGIKKNPKYISIKNASHYVNNNPDFKEVIQMLFNIHLNNNMIIPDNTMYINNKFVYKKNDFVDIIKGLNQNISIDMINRFKPDVIINIITMLEKEEVNKFIIFYNEYYNKFENCNFYNSLIKIYDCYHSNHLLYFLCFYILVKKNIIEPEHQNIYYSNIYKPFIKDVIRYVNENFQKETIIDLDFISYNNFKYVFYKKILKSKLKETNYYIKSCADKFVLLFNKFNTKLEYKITHIRYFEVYKIAINENIIIDLKNLNKNHFWLKSSFKDVVVLISVSFDSSKNEYSINDIFVSNNYPKNNYDFINDIYNFISKQKKIFSSIKNKKTISFNNINKVKKLNNDHVNYADELPF